MIVYNIHRTMSQGLKNLGNTCSVNTLVQCIGHCDYLRDMLLTVQLSNDNNNSRNGDSMSITEELARVIKHLWVDKIPIAPIRFLKTLFYHFSGIMTPGEQLDMSELWMLVVDKINDETGQPAPDPNINGADTEAFKQAWKSHNQKCMSRWLQTVQGWTATRIRCSSCDKETVMYEPFCSLGLDVCHGHTSLDQMFDVLFRKEKIESRECDHCKAHHPAVKSTTVCMYPKVLVIYFKRFGNIEGGGMKKLANPIHLPMNMRFARLDGVYSLCSIGNHIGCLDGGHYFSTARDNKGNWYMYDDATVSQINNVSQVLSTNREAYMLVYELKKN